MSGTVDDEVVRMRFDNSAFERGVAGTLRTLAKLKSSLKFGGADKGLSDIENRASRFHLGGVTTAVDGVSKKFLALSTVALTALSNIASKALSAGGRVLKSFTIGPIIDGFHEYETQLNSVQTILANTGLKGSSGMDQVNGALNELNTYSDKTIYNFGEMARNIGTFTAAGVKLQPATQAIKGIANVAALSGSNSQQASTAMYQLSQAIANNKVGLQDWNSVVNAGMGGKVFQAALFNTGKALHTIKGVDMNTSFDKWKASGNSFRDSLKSGWITGKVLTNTLASFTGDLTAAQLKSMGYHKDQIKTILEQAKTAQDAATKVKTFTQLMGTLKEAVGSGWSNSFKLIFGNFNEARDLWTGVSKSVGTLISNSANARNKVLSDWKALGGRKVLIDGIRSAFTSLGSVIKPIKDAFRDIFPAQTGKNLYDLTVRFANFMKSLKIGPETADKLHRTFAGFFALLDIGKQILAGIFHAFSTLFGKVTEGSGGFLTFTAHVGDMVVAFDKALKKGNLITNFFHIIGTVLAIPLQLLKQVGLAIAGLFSGFSKSDATGMNNSIGNAGDKLAHVADIMDNVSGWFAGLGAKIRPAVNAVVKAFQKMGSAIAKGLGSKSFSNILDGLKVGLLGGIMVMIKKFLSKGFKVDIGGGLLGKAGEALDGLTGNLKAMQMQLKAKALLEIAAAIGIITLSVIGLSLIDSSKLQSALAAMAAGFGELLGAMAILTKVSGSAGFVKIPIMAASLDLLAAAILLLSVSVMLLSTLSWSELERGLTAVGVLLGVLAAASIPLSANSSGMIRAGVGITAMAIALNILYLAVRNFAGMKWGDLAKGLGTVAAALAGISGAMRIMPKGMLAQGAALVLIAGAINLLYLAVKDFAGMKWGDLIKGLAGVGGALVAIAAGMKLMPKGMVAQAAALVLVGAALQLIDKAVADMAKLSWTELAKGLTGLAGALVILAGALKVMSSSLAGAAALLIVAAALHLFVPALQALGQMSWAEIASGLGALAASFAVIGLAAALMSEAIPAMIGLGVALALVGLAMLAFGAGAVMLGAGLASIAAAGGAAIGVIISGLRGLIGLLPTLGTNLAMMLVSFATIITKNAPGIINMFVSLLNELLKAVPKIMPNLLKAINSLIETILQALVTNIPKIIKAGFQLLMSLLKGIRDNIPRIVTVVADIIVRFLNALGDNLPRIIEAGVQLLRKFLIGIAKALGEMPGIVLEVIWAFLSSLAKNLWKIVSGGGSLLGKFVGGILGNIGKMASAAATVVARFAAYVASNAWRLITAGAGSLASLVSGLVGGIGSAATTVASKAYELASGLVGAIVDGLRDLAGNAIQAVKDIGGDIIDGIAGALHIGGPSRDFIEVGRGLGTGLIIGIGQIHNSAVGSVENMGTDAISTMKKTMTGLGAAIATSSIEYNPTITPILDLTTFSKDANQMKNLIKPSMVAAQLSYTQAQDISAARRAALEAEATTPAAEPPPPTTVNLEQNNYSPKALSTVDIYRQTKNQLAQAKSILGVPAG